MQTKGMWGVIRRHAHQLFPALAVLVCIIIFTSPFYEWPVAWLSDVAFGRFCMFWVLSACIVLSFANRHYRPAAVSVLSFVVSLVVGIAFTAIYVSGTATAEAIPEVTLSYLSGAILGALAGTWLMYVLEVYWG